MEILGIYGLVIAAIAAFVGVVWTLDRIRYVFVEAWYDALLDRKAWYWK